MFVRKMSNSGIKPVIISIEGDIGSGKSTLLASLREKYPELHFIDEPLDTWTSLKNEEGESLLHVFYKDIKRWSYTFQNCAILSRAQNIRKAVTAWENECVVDPSKAIHNIFITERCLETDKNVFAQMLRDDGKLDGIEWDLYHRWYEMLDGVAPIDALVYVNTGPETCLERIKGRGRDGEMEIPLDYLRNLDKYHKRWIESTPIKVMQFNNSDLSVKMHSADDIWAFIQSMK
jgi:deoxyadenosine/deoxycytidine kinase